jgi:hypothetical protein
VVEPQPLYPLFSFLPHDEVEKSCSIMYSHHDVLPYYRPKTMSQNTTFLFVCWLSQAF